MIPFRRWAAETVQGEHRLKKEIACCDSSTCEGINHITTQGTGLLSSSMRMMEARRHCCLMSSSPRDLCVAPVKVCKGIRQGKRGICVIAGDITPIDVISHLAYHCEEQGIHYM